MTVTDPRLDYIAALIDRLRRWPVEADATPLLDRIEAQLDRIGTITLDVTDAAVDAIAELRAASKAASNIPDPFIETGTGDPDAGRVALHVEQLVAVPANQVEAIVAAEAELAADEPSDHHTVFSDLEPPDPIVDVQEAGNNIRADLTPDVAERATVPLTVERLRELGHAPKGHTWTPEQRAAVAEKTRARNLSSPKVACDPGCGREFSTYQIGSHQRACPDREAYRAAHTVDKGGRQGPAPLPDGDVDVAAERDAFQAKRAASARAAADKAWAARHPGEVRV